MSSEIRWFRSEDGAIAGVCKGLSESLDLEVGIIRLAFLFLFLFGGSGLLFYMALAISLPRKDKLNIAYEPKVLGVCSSLAQRFSIEVSLVRLFAVLSAFASFGVATLVYLGLYFFLPQVQSSKLKDLN